MFRARAFGPLCLAVVLSLSYAPSASALAIFEAFGLAGIEVDGDVVVAFEEPEPNGPILFAPLSLGPGETSTDTAESAGPGGPSDPGFENFDFDTFVPDNLAASAFAWVLGAAQGPAAFAAAAASATDEVFLINDSDVPVEVAVTLHWITAAFATVDDAATESAASEGTASIFDIGSLSSSADSAGPVETAIDLAMTITRFEIDPGSFVSYTLAAAAKGEAMSDQVIPEPTTAILLGLGLLGLGTRRRAAA